MISIVIPVFNGEKHIMKCYSSLYNQIYQYWEALFIDDGSTDSSFELLNSISDPRVKVYRKTNEGVAIAREFGLQHAEGEYVTFLDVDDTLCTNALERYIDSFTKDESDIVIGGINMISEMGNPISRITYPQMSLSGENAVDLMCNGGIRWQICGKAFRISLFQDVITPKGLRSAEDMAVCLQATINARKVIVLNDCLYNYVQVPTSVTHSKAKEISYDALKAVKFVESTIGDRLESTALDCLYLLIISSALRAGISAKDKLFREAVKEHGRLNAMAHLSVIKAINICVFKFCHLNIARFF